MAYSDYGGYAYRNGVRVKERSDTDSPCSHVLLGDGAIFVGLFKTCFFLFRQTEIVNAPNFEVDVRPRTYGLYEIDGHRITFVWEDKYGHYIFAKLEQPDGNVWHGFSGYGVGAGLEKSKHGFSTKKRVKRLWEIFK